MNLPKSLRVYLSRQQRPEPSCFEQIGFDAMMRTRNREAAEEICALELHAYRDELGPEIAGIERKTASRQTAAAALHCDLYEREDAVQDSWMLVQTVLVGIFAALTLAAAFLSCAAHITILSLMGWTVMAWMMGPALTVLAVLVGFIALEKLLSRHKALETIVVAVAVAVGTWGMVEWAQSRAVVVTYADAPSSTPTSSYVDGADETPAKQTTSQSDETVVREKSKAAWIKILLSADLLVGIFLGYYVQRKTEPDYAAWQQLKHLQKEISDLQFQRDYLLSLFEIAKKKCMAGILRAQHTPGRKHRPYFRALTALLFTCILIRPSSQAQVTTHQEAILIDISGSIGAGTGNGELFREYLRGVRHLLATEPPNSRVIVSVITTESFGSVRELLKGRTPEQHGLFTAELDRARQQLVSRFEEASGSLSPVAAGTDIIGALWHVEALLESSINNKDKESARDIWIFSDMMNETPGLSMPPLLATGAEGVLERARANGLIVPLKGFKIHIVGASTSGLTPLSWNTVKSFWESYFKEAGADLVLYSIESHVTRKD